MSYVTNADIEQRVGSQVFVHLADDDGDGAADVAVVDEVRLASEGEVDSYLAGRFAVPVDVAAHPELADLLKSITLDLAEYRLRLRRPPVARDVVDRYRLALQWLADVADGRIELPAATAVAPGELRGPRAVVSGESRVLTHGELSGH